MHKGIHVIPIEDLLPGCIHVVMEKLEDIRDKLGTEIKPKPHWGRGVSNSLQDLRATATDLIDEIKDANYNINYFHIGCIEAFANLLAKAGLGPYKRRLDKAVTPVYDYVRGQQSQRG